MAKPTPLVCQFLEKISGKALEKYQRVIRNFVGKRHGVYALYRRDRLYYVGLASNLRNRLRSHLRDRHKQKWDRFSVYLTIGDSHIKEMESLILRIGNPPGNKVKGKFSRAENLKNRLAEQIRQENRMLLQDLIGRKKVSPRIKISSKRQSAPKGRQPILGFYELGSIKLKGKWKNRMVYSRVRKDGSISYKGEVYKSPSLAGKAVVGHACNGWTFWHYERAPGDWVRLNNLKR